MAKGDKILRGILVPAPTFFLDDGEIDEACMRQLVRFYLAAGVHGLWLGGSFGMGPVMTIPQRRRLVELVAEELGGRAPFVVHAGTADVFTSSELARHAEAAGALAVGIVPPYYYSDHNDYEIREHYRRVAAAVELPLFVYDNPYYTGISMHVERVLELKAAIPSIRGIKLNVMNPERALDYLRLLPDDIAVFTGSLPNLMAGKPKGFDGAIHPPTAHLPELCLELWEALEANDLHRAVALHHRLDQISGLVMSLWKSRGRVASKECFRLRGLDVKLFPRWPSRELTPEDVAALRSAHEAIGAPLEPARA